MIIFNIDSSVIIFLMNCLVYKVSDYIEMLTIISNNRKRRHNIRLSFFGQKTVQKPTRYSVYGRI